MATQKCIHSFFSACTTAVERGRPRRREGDSTFLEFQRNIMKTHTAARKVVRVHEIDDAYPSSTTKVARQVPSDGRTLAWESENE